MALLTGGLNFVYAALPLILVVLAKDSGATPIETGLIFSIGGCGGIVGALIGGRLQRRFTFGQVIVAVMWANVVLLPLYLLSSHVMWLGVVYALSAVTGPIYNVVQFSYRISLIPDALQGRVNSTFRLVAFGLNPLGAIVAGFILERTDAVVTVLFFAAWFALFASASTLNRDVRHAQAIGVAQPR